MPEMPLERPKKTVADYLALAEEYRVELIEGDFYGTAPHSLANLRALRDLVLFLAAHVKARAAGAVIPGIDVHLPTGDVVRPDVTFVAAPRAGPYICST